MAFGIGSPAVSALAAHPPGSRNGGFTSLGNGPSVFGKPPRTAPVQKPPRVRGASPTLHGGPVIASPSAVAAAPPTPGAQPAAPSPAVTAAPSTTTPAQADPRDATYFTNVAANQFKANQSIGRLQQSTGQGQIGLQDNLAKLAQAQAQANTRSQESENAAGGFALGHLSQNLGQINSAYLGQQQAANQNFANLKANNDRGIAGELAGEPIYANQQLAASAGRAATAASTDNTLGLTPDQTTNPAQAPGGIDYAALARMIAAQQQGSPPTGPTFANRRVIAAPNMFGKSNPHPVNPRPVIQARPIFGKGRI